MKRDEMADLVVYAAVAEELSFTKAARRLGMSQSALSQIVKRLEARLGFRLLTRTTRSVAPTKAGEKLLETLLPMFDDLDKGISEITKRAQRPSGKVRINAVEHAVNSYIVPALTKVLSEHPEIAVEIDADYGLVDIVASRFDAGVRLGEQVEKDMIAVPISPPIEMAIVAAPDYLGGRKPPEAPKDLREHSCLNLRMPSSGDFYEWRLQKKGKSVHVKLEGQLVFNALGPILQAARNGLGIANVPLDQVGADLNTGRLVRLLDDWSDDLPAYHLYYPNRRNPASAFRTIVDALRWRG